MLSKASPLCQSPGGFHISPLLQEHMLRMGSKLVFEEACEELELLIGVDMSAKQIERVCHFYGDLLEQLEWGCTTNLPFDINLIISNLFYYIC